MFRTEEYDEWDKDGIPLKDKEGNEITKSKGKRLRKEWERQRKMHEKWVEMNLQVQMEKTRMTEIEGVREGK